MTADKVLIDCGDMRTKGALGTVTISLAMLNKLLSADAQIPVSKAYHKALMLVSSNSIEDDETASVLKSSSKETEEKEVQISVETY